MASYVTLEGDRLDLVVWDHYQGDPARLPALVVIVLEANRGLAAHGPILPAGVTITLPEVEATPASAPTVRLWD
jgi:phage tail protein X